MGAFSVSAASELIVAQLVSDAAAITAAAANAKMFFFIRFAFMINKICEMRVAELAVSIRYLFLTAQR
jgi:hypothetical protein